jgi:hypothetical protein
MHCEHSLGVLKNLTNKLSAMQKWNLRCWTVGGGSSNSFVECIRSYVSPSTTKSATVDMAVEFFCTLKFLNHPCHFCSFFMLFLFHINKERALSLIGHA